MGTTTQHNVDIKDKLETVFDILKGEGIFAEENFRFDVSGATADIPDGVRAVYYHAQDVDHFEKTGKMFIRYFSGQDDDGRSSRLLAVEVKTVLERAGLTTTWNGDDRHALLVEGLMPPRQHKYYLGFSPDTHIQLNQFIADLTLKGYECHLPDVSTGIYQGQILETSSQFIAQQTGPKRLCVHCSEHLVGNALAPNNSYVIHYGAGTASSRQISPSTRQGAQERSR